MQVLLLDEITVDMDVVGRLDLLKFFVEECETRGATIIYATHIFDGLEKWITHVAYLADGQLRIGTSLTTPNLKGRCQAHGLSANLWTHVTPCAQTMRSSQNMIEARTSAGLPVLWQAIAACLFVPKFVNRAAQNCCLVHVNEPWHIFRRWPCE